MPAPRKKCDEPVAERSAAGDAEGAASSEGLADPPVDDAVVERVPGAEHAARAGPARRLWAIATSTDLSKARPRPSAAAVWLSWVKAFSNTRGTPSTKVGRKVATSSSRRRGSGAWPEPHPAVDRADLDDAREDVGERQDQQRGGVVGVEEVAELGGGRLALVEEVGVGEHAALGLARWCRRCRSGWRRRRAPRRYGVARARPARRTRRRPRGRAASSRLPAPSSSMSHSRSSAGRRGAHARPAARRTRRSRRTRTGTRSRAGSTRSARPRTWRRPAPRPRRPTRWRSRARSTPAGCAPAGRPGRRPRRRRRAGHAAASTTRVRKSAAVTSSQSGPDGPGTRSANCAASGCWSACATTGSVSRLQGEAWGTGGAAYSRTWLLLVSVLPVGRHDRIVRRLAGADRADAAPSDVSRATSEAPARARATGG